MSLLNKIFGNKEEDYNYKISVMARSVGLYYQTFSSKQKVLEFLKELRDTEKEIMDEVYENSEVNYISFINIYYIEVTKDGEEIDRFDPTEESEFPKENISQRTIKMNTEDQPNGYLYSHQYLKSLFEVNLETNERYAREKLSIDLDIYQCQLPVDWGWASEDDEEAPDVNEHQIANIKYNNKELLLDSNPSGGEEETYFSVLIEDKEFKIDPNEDPNDLITQLEWRDSPKLRADRKAVLEVVSQNGLMLEHVDNSLKDDPEVVLVAVNNNSDAFKYADDSVKANSEVVLAAVNQDGSVLEFVADSLKADPEVVLAAVNQDGEAFKYADDSIKANRKVNLAVVNQDGLLLEYLDDTFKADQEMVLAAVNQDGDAFEYAADSLKADREVVLAAVNNSSNAFYYAADSLKADREVVLAAMNSEYKGRRFENPQLEYADDSLKADREVVLAAVNQNGLALEYAANSLKSDREVVLAAVKKDGDALGYASKELQQDEDLKKIANK
jgi:hypothetical protein